MSPTSYRPAGGSICAKTATTTWPSIWDTRGGSTNGGPSVSWGATCICSDTDHSLPVDLTAGAALDTFLSDAHEITVGADLGYYFYPKDVRGYQMSLGVEYNLMQLVQFRGGYHYGEQRYYYPSYWSAGVGVRILHLRLDFAYLFAKKETLLHNTYSLSFGFDF